MTTLAKWDPWRELDDFSDRLSTLFGRVPNLREGRGDGLSQLAPPVDISEDDKEFLIKAELPGIEKDHVKVAVEEGMLVISGERKEEKEEKNRRYHRVERTQGSFMRSFTLPDTADGTQIKAEFKNGILEVHLPKTEKAKAKMIEIKVN